MHVTPLNPLVWGKSQHRILWGWKGRGYTSGFCKPPMKQHLRGDAWPAWSMMGQLWDSSNRKWREPPSTGLSLPHIYLSWKRESKMLAPMLWSTSSRRATLQISTSCWSTIPQPLPKMLIFPPKLARGRDGDLDPMWNLTYQPHLLFFKLKLSSWTILLTLCTGCKMGIVQRGKYFSGAADEWYTAREIRAMGSEFPPLLSTNSPRCV